LRDRIAGTVMRLPGTGEGVARLVALSMVKVDMASLVAPRFWRNHPRFSAPASPLHTAMAWVAIIDVGVASPPRWSSGSGHDRTIRIKSLFTQSM
jgi:hypothetical protein